MIGVSILHRATGFAKRLACAVTASRTMRALHDVFKRTPFGKSGYNSLDSEGFAVVPCVDAADADIMLSEVRKNMMKKKEGSDGFELTSRGRGTRIKDQRRYMHDTTRVSEVFSRLAAKVGDTLASVLAALDYGKDIAVVEKLTVLISDAGVGVQVCHAICHSMDWETRPVSRHTHRQDSHTPNPQIMLKHRASRTNPRSTTTEADVPSRSEREGYSRQDEPWHRKR